MEFDKSLNTKMVVMKRMAIGSSVSTGDKTRNNEPRLK